MRLNLRTAWVRRIGGVAVILCGLLVTAAGASAGALDDFLASPPVIDNPPWGDKELQKMIPRCLQRMADGPEPIDRAAAVGDLAMLARCMATAEPAKAAARDLLERHVIPHLDLTREADETTFCSWRRTVLVCRHVYEKLGDEQKVDEWLTVLEEGSPREGDREMAIYLRAHLRAEQARYQEAIDALLLIPPSSQWSAHRDVLVKRWQWKIAKLENPDLKPPTKPHKLRKAGKAKAGKSKVGNTKAAVPALKPEKNLNPSPQP